MANILILGFVLFCLGMACYRLPSFIMNRQYIQMEMKRAETEREFRHWKREMRRLYRGYAVSAYLYQIETLR